MGGWVRDGTHKLSRWEAHPAVDDVGQPGGDPARHQRRHPGVPLVRARPPEADGLQQPGRRGRDRPAPLERRGPAVEQRREHLQPDDRRRDAGLRHDGRRSRTSRRASATARRSSGSSSARAATCARSRCSSASSSPSAIQARRTRRSGIQPQMHRGMKYAGMRAASNVLLRDVNVSLIIEEMYRGANVIYADFTDYDELAHHCGPERVESFAGARWRRRRDRDPREGRRGRAAAVQVRDPVRSRPEPRRDVQAALRHEPRRGRPRPDERPRNPRPDEDRGRGLDVRELVPLGDHPQQGRRTDRRPRGPRAPDEPTASSTSTTRRSRRRPTSRRSPSSAPATSGSSGSRGTTTA